ncbi:response regulator transcription factor [Paludibacterium paludis]|uniref:DNA-binding response regulator n=1 Tax=Paludibacterium paludis TaxID=1225769 RepID=A0A918UAB0_9NEIS|nr:response regulator transcription factor [Paludibacterium paludis]GGY16297.1 DNA-binding response regulator [Paludibacterium paludis]
MSKILLVEDDQKLSRLMTQFLAQHGFDVSPCFRGDEAVAAYKSFQPDLVVLDLMLPGRDGLQVCRDIRGFSSVPILMLSAREEDVDQIIGLESGADDYVIKPVEPPVLLARIRARLRRPQAGDEERDVLSFGSLLIDRGNRRVVRDGLPVDVTTMEFETLWVLASHAGRVLSRDDIMNLVRGIDFNGLDRTVDVCISRLRRKLEDDPREPRHIKTVWGRGYLFSTLEWTSQGC